MGSLNYSLGYVLPVRKVSLTHSPLLLKHQKSVLLKAMCCRIYKGHNRLPNSLQECIDRPVPTIAIYRPFLVMFFILPMMVYFYRGLDFSDMNLNLNTVSLITRNDTTRQIKDTRLDKTTKAPKSDIHTGWWLGGDVSASGERTDDATELTIDASLDYSPKNKNDILPHNPPVCDISAVYKKGGNFTINLNVTREAAFAVNPLVSKGGYYKPTKCETRHRIAILVAYRHREENLAIFLTNIHQFLIEQQIEYRIYVIEQSGKEKFNKGRVLNAGFHQIKEEWDCFIFHDVDLLPLDRRILYACPSYPRYMSTRVYEGGKEIIYLTHFFGGVTAMTDYHFILVDGYSNRFWGWGGEDNDMYWRIRKANLPVTKYNRDIARYLMLPHAEEAKNPKRFELLNKYSGSKSGNIKGGLSTLRYTVVFKKMYPLFTHIVVDVNPYKDPVD